MAFAEMLFTSYKRSALAEWLRCQRAMANMKGKKEIRKSAIIDLVMEIEMFRRRKQKPECFCHDFAWLGMRHCVAICIEFVI